MKVQVSVIGMVLLGTVMWSGLTQAKENENLTLVENELQTSKWNELERFPAAYPYEMARQLEDGCATIDYIITPTNQIEDITVASTSNAAFAKAASAVVSNWKWSELPGTIVEQRVKTRTRFEFCVAGGDKPCTAATIQSSCPGDDVIVSKAERLN